jgi:membrane glycosyltransferase
MPEQRFDGNPPATIEVETRPPGLLVRRLLLICATAVISMAASTDVRIVLERDATDALDVLVLLLFVPLFSWVAFGFVSACIGFGKLVLREHPGFAPVPHPASALRHRTAVLMPVHNEPVEATFGRIATMLRSIAAAGGTDFFDFFVLSDSSELHGRHEREAWSRLAATLPVPLYYRRRAENIGRKPGNIAEWVRRFGGAYEHMIVLDADSMMSGEAMIGLASIMETRPTVGLLQTVPMITNARTLFQRWMQFSACVYGPIASAGLVWWSGSEANFWGHNAIIRTRAFAQCCGLPELPGRRPFGGAIQSHDMVEAALLRRRGWAVHMVMIDASYEEFPPTIVDFAIRDRRWAQGNLQHLRLLGAAGFHWTSRLHLLIGASSYLTSPAWLLFIVAEIAQALLGRHNILVDGPPVRVFALTLLCLFGAKLMGAAWVLADAERRRLFGGAPRVLASVLLDVVLSILLAPVTMVNQTKAMFGLLLGVASEWTAQSRESEGVSLRSILPRTREHLALGAAFVGVSVLDPTLGLWLSPVTAGLLTAPWLIALTSRTSLGNRARAAGLFAAPPQRIGPNGGDGQGLEAASGGAHDAAPAPNTLSAP